VFVQHPQGPELDPQHCGVGWEVGVTMAWALLVYNFVFPALHYSNSLVQPGLLALHCTSLARPTPVITLYIHDCYH
jgi:hypothetical protein